MRNLSLISARWNKSSVYIFCTICCCYYNFCMNSCLFSMVQNKKRLFRKNFNIKMISCFFFCVFYVFCCFIFYFSYYNVLAAVAFQPLSCANYTHSIKEQETLKMERKFSPARHYNNIKYNIKINKIKKTHFKCSHWISIYHCLHFFYLTLFVQQTNNNVRTVLWVSGKTKQKWHSHLWNVGKWMWKILSSFISLPK